MEKTIVEYFYENEKKWADRPFLHQPFGDKWETYTWAKVGEMARRLATWLRQKCPKEKAHVSIVSSNCTEWTICEIGIYMAGFINAPLYNNLSGSQIEEVIAIGDIDILLMGKVVGWESMKKGIPEGMPIGKFPQYEGHPVLDIGTTWDEIMACEPLQEKYIPSMDDLWSIIFTSGTTGTPKGVTFTNRKVQALLDSPHWDYWFKTDRKNGTNRMFSYLPANHIAARTTVLASIAFGGDVFHVESLETFTQNLKDAKPSSFFAVPRIWTKFKQGILSKLPQEQLDAMLADPKTKAVISQQLKAGFGLENAKLVITGAAPMSAYDIAWWENASFPFSEAYGQTENFGVATYAPVGKMKSGTVGIAHDFIKLKIDPDTSELLIQTPFIMDGYYKNEAKTNETIKDGWLHTGDTGRIDAEGYLTITGRINDTFKTEKGQFIVPLKIENDYCSNGDIEQLCLMGRGMPHPIMLIVPSENGAAKSKEDLANSLHDTMVTVNKDLPNYTRVGTVVIAKEPFTIENGLMTPTMKIKRNKMSEKYGGEQLRTYCEDEQRIIWE